ncbi:MAG: hypothetical protein ACKVKP_13805 [Acidimicrobiales bacterium]
MEKTDDGYFHTPRGDTHHANSCSTHQHANEGPVGARPPAKAVVENASVGQGPVSRGIPSG